MELSSSFNPIISNLFKQTENLNNVYEFSCHDKVKNFSPEKCMNGVSHCDLKEGGDFCFNGYSILDEGKSSNKTMVSFLCTNLELPPYIPETGLKFGPCYLTDPYENPLTVEGKMNCYCLKKQWSCFAK